MGGLDKRAPFTATGGIIPPEFQNVKTPCYILDEKALIKNAKLLGEVSERTGCKMLLAQKAFSNYDCYRFFEPYLAGTEASGLFEARLGAEEMPGKEVHVFCAGYRADEFEELLQYADHIVFNSPSQLLRFGAKAKEAGKSVGLRINPECSTQEGHEIYDTNYMLNAALERVDFSKVVKVYTRPTGVDWKKYEDGKEYNGTLTIKNEDGFVLATLNVTMTKEIPTTLPQGFSIKDKQVIDGIYNCYMIADNWAASQASKGAMPIENLINFGLGQADQYNVTFASSVKESKQRKLQRTFLSLPSFQQ